MFDRDTTHWYPMRVSYSRYSRLMRIKNELDKLNCENYIPMEYRTVNFRVQLMPAINNIIFVRTNYKVLSEIRRMSQFVDLRYIMHYVFEGQREASQVLFVPDRQMTDFIRVSSVHDNRTVYMDNLEYACRPGLNVEIMEGYFAGVKGVVKRIDGSKCVVVPIKEVAAVAIRNVPSRLLRVLSNEEFE